ncbi:hypothetical protein I5G17_11385 [Pseudomonas aeruginosa]|nr:hypothetical protein [Pseudomonas aeruginosa]
MMANAVEHQAAFEIYREVAVIPAHDGRLADRGMFLVGQAEALQHGFAAFAVRGQGDPGIALGAQRNAQGVGEQRRGEEEGAQQ